LLRLISSNSDLAQSVGDSCIFYPATIWSRRGTVSNNSDLAQSVGFVLYKVRDNNGHVEIVSNNSDLAQSVGFTDWLKAKGYDYTVSNNSDLAQSVGEYKIVGETETTEGMKFPTIPI